jgi:hypothetical protein
LADLTRPFLGHVAAPASLLALDSGSLVTEHWFDDGERVPVPYEHRLWLKNEQRTHSNPASVGSHASFGDAGVPKLPGKPVVLGV